MISNVLDQFLNESTEYGAYNIEKPEPLSESESFEITPDANGVALLKEQDDRDLRKLDMAMLNLNAVSLTESYKIDMNERNGLLSESAVEDRRLQIVNLQEAGIVDYWNKFIAMIKKAWQRMVTWFKNLFKSIAVATLDVKKSLKDVDKILAKKSFEKFSYTGHDWKESTIYSTLGSGIKAIGNEFKKDIDNAKNTAKSYVKIKTKEEDETEIKANDSRTPKNKELDLKESIGKLVGKQGTSTSIEQAKDVIAASYGYNESKEITGCDWKTMTEYLRNFDKSKTITESQKTCDDNYKELIGKAEDAKKFCSDKSSSTSDKTDAKRTVESRFNAVIRAIESAIKYNNQCLGAYDTLIGYCVSIEKAKFGEYRSVVSKAIRYNPKSAS